LPLPNVLYNKPTKSSADGDINISNLPFLAPWTAALASDIFCLAPIPVDLSIILLNSAFILFEAKGVVVKELFWYGDPSGAPSRGSALVTAIAAL